MSEGSRSNRSRSNGSNKGGADARNLSRDSSRGCGRESVSEIDMQMQMGNLDYSEPQENSRMMSRIPNDIPDELYSKAWVESVWASNGQVGGGREMTRFVPPHRGSMMSRSSVQV